MQLNQSGTSKNTMKKKLVVLMSAAAVFAATGAALPARPAFAETVPAAASPVAAEKPAAPRVDYIALSVHQKLSSIASDAATVADKAYDELMDAVRSGQSLAAASGLGSAELADKLGALYAQSFDGEVAAGYMTREEADEANRLAAAAVRETIDTSGAAVGPLVRTVGRDIVDKATADVVQNVAFLSDKSSIELRAALRQGQSLTEASGLDAATLSASLLESVAFELDRAVRYGQLAAQEAADLKAEAARSIDEALATKGYDPETNEWMERYGDAIIDKRLSNLTGIAAALADKSYADVEDALAQGGTLLSATGLSEAELLDRLAASVDVSIEQAWQSGTLSARAADALKAEAADRLKEAIATAGYGTRAQSGAKSDSAIAKESVDQLVRQAASYAGKTAAEVREALGAGQTLVQATGIDQAELYGVLQGNAGAYIEKAVASGRLAAVDADATKQEASERIGSAIAKPGYVGEADADAYLNRLRGTLVDQVADWAGTTREELLEKLASGQSLAQAVGTDADTLLHALLRGVNRDWNEYAAEGRLTAQESAPIKANMAAELLALVTNG